MTPRFPLKVDLHKGAGDIPPGPDTYGIFEAGGLWASLGGVTFQFPASAPGAAVTTDHVVRMLNAAYEQGRADKLAEIKSALEIDEL